MPQSKYTNSVGMDERIRELQALGLEYEDAIQQYQKEQQAKKQPNRVDTEIATTGGDAVSLGVPTTSIEAQDREPPEIPAQAGSNTALRILEVLGGIGGSLAESKAMGKATKATQAAQARANLINTLRGRAVSGVQPTEPKRGILGTLSRGLGAGAKAFREGREFESQEDKTRFEAEMALGELDIKREKSGKILPVKPTERKTFYTTEGRRLWDKNPDLSVAEIDAKIRASDQYRVDVGNEEDRLGPEFLGFAREGYENARKTALGERREEESDFYLRSEEERARQKMDDKESANLLDGFTNSLNALALTGVYKTLPDGESVSEIGEARNLFEEYEIANMPLDWQLKATGIHKFWAAKYHQMAFDKAQKDREEARKNREEVFRSDKMKFDVLQADFDVMETLRSSVQALPGVKAFSGTQGIGPAFAKLDAAYQKYGKGDIGRDAMQLALVNQFQRLIDPATVREGDIALMLRAESWWARLNGRVEGYMDGGFVADKTIKSMHKVAVELERAHRGFVEDEVEGAIKVWNGIHKNFTVDEETSNLIIQSILGGYLEEKTVEVLY